MGSHGRGFSLCEAVQLGEGRVWMGCPSFSMSCVPLWITAESIRRLTLWWWGACQEPRGRKFVWGEKCQPDKFGLVAQRICPLCLSVLALFRGATNGKMEHIFYHMNLKSLWGGGTGVLGSTWDTVDLRVGRPSGILWFQNLCSGD